MTVHPDTFAEATGGSKLRLYVDREFYTEPGFRFALIRGTSSPGGPYEHGVFEMKPVEPQTPVNPGFVLAPAAAQELLDELWRLGLRPSKGTARGEVEEAMKDHLEDLRRIACHALKIGGEA